MKEEVMVCTAMGIEIDFYNDCCGGNCPYEYEYTEDIENCMCRQESFEDDVILNLMKTMEMI